MRLWQRITGGAATVTVELDRTVVMPGETLAVRATVTANNDVEGKSALITLAGQEEVTYQEQRYDNEGRASGTTSRTERNQTMRAEQRISGPIKLTAGEQYTLEAYLQVPLNAQPTYLGRHARHTYRLTVALDLAWSKDPAETVEVMVGLGRPPEVEN